MSFNDLLGFEKYFVGFDNYFNEIQKSIPMFKDSFNLYPPFNIKKTDANTYVIELAVAGFVINELEVVVENSVLKIAGKHHLQEEVDKFLHKGISSKSFLKQIKLADNVEVKTSTLSNGILKIWLEHFVKETDIKKTEIVEETPLETVVKTKKTKE